MSLAVQDRGRCIHNPLVKVLLSIGGVCVLLYAVYATYQAILGPAVFRNSALGFAVASWALGLICLGLVDIQRDK